MPLAPDLLEVRVSVPDRATGARLADLVVAGRLAACVQVLGPMTSTYAWQGAVESSQEWLLLAKTTTDRWPPLVALVEAEHPYETPEVIAVPVVAASPGYAAWVRQSVSD